MLDAYPHDPFHRISPVQLVMRRLDQIECLEAKVVAQSVTDSESHKGNIHKALLYIFIQQPEPFTFNHPIPQFVGENTFAIDWHDDFSVQANAVADEPVVDVELVEHAMLVFDGESWIDSLTRCEIIFGDEDGSDFEGAVGGGLVGVGE